LFIEFDIFDPDGAITRKSFTNQGEVILMSKKQITVPNPEGFSVADLIVSLSYDLYDGLGRQDVDITTFPITCRPDVVLSSIKNSFAALLDEFYQG
jgi:hypothetical protein